MNITEEKKQNLTKITKGMSDLVFSNALIAGKIKNADGIMIYEPFKSKQEFIEAVNHGQEIGYNTHTMGRGIFTVNEDGSITNYKGVDSHLEDKDSYAVQFQKLCGKKTEMSKIIDVTNTSSYGMSIIIEGENIELRTRGASELLNLINEKDKTTKLQAQDNAHLIKIENLEELIPFSAQFCEKYFLPKKVKPGYKKKRNEQIKKLVSKAKRKHINELYNKRNHRNND